MQATPTEPDRHAIALGMLLAARIVEASENFRKQDEFLWMDTVGAIQQAAMRIMEQDVAARFTVREAYVGELV